MLFLPKKLTDNSLICYPDPDVSFLRLAARSVGTKLIISIYTWMISLFSCYTLPGNCENQNNSRIDIEINYVAKFLTLANLLNQVESNHHY